jgi:hypothetical protein
MDQAKRQKELEEENGKLKQLVADSLDKADPERYCGGKLLSPQRLPGRGACPRAVRVSEQRACRLEWHWPPRRTEERAMN